MNTIIITGANGNLGSVVTKLFLEKGYRVIATVVNDAAKMDLLPEDHLDVEVVNLTNEQETYSFIQSAINKYGRIEGALLLVGGFSMGNIHLTSGTDIQKQFSLNFETAYYVSRPLFEHFIKNNKGKLVYIGARPSLIASQGKDLLAYSLSKSLLFKLADFLNEEAKGKNVSVTVAVPSTIDTAVNRKYMPDADPSNWVNPEALAEVLEFICSEKGDPLRETILKVYNNA